MKRFITLLLTFLSIMFVANSQSVTKKVSPGDTVSVVVDFGKVSMSDDAIASQEQLKAMIATSSKTTDALASSVNRFTDVVGQGILLNQQTRIDIMSKELNVTPEKLKKIFKRNGNIKMISIIPTLLFALFLTYKLTYGMNIRGVDWDKLIKSAVAGLFYTAVIGISLYYFISVIWNPEYHLIKELASALFQ